MKEYIDSYAELPIGKYMEIMEVVGDKEADQYDKNLAVVSILTDIDEVELYNMPINQFNSLYQLTAFLQKKPEEKMIKDKYKLGSYELVTVFGAGEMTTAQFIDYQNYVKDAQKNLIELLSIFLIPKGKTYNNGYDLDDVQKTIRENLTVEEALGLSAFFLRLFKALLKVTLDYLEKTVKKMKKNMKDPEKITEMEKKIKDLEAVGDGLVLLIK